MKLWTVHRVWRNIGAETVTEAIGYAEPGEHDEVRAAAQHEGADALAQLYYTREELEVLQMSVGLAIVTAEENLRRVRSDLLGRTLREQWSILNALRTSLAEARYGLMTRAEVDAEQAAQAEARDAGIIP